MVEAVIFYSTTKCSVNPLKWAYLVGHEKIEKLYKKVAQIPLTYFQYNAIVKFHCESRGDNLAESIHKESL